MIEREGESDARALHDRKARGIDSRELVEILAPEILPRLLQITQLAGKNLGRAGLIDRVLPCKRHVPVGVAFEEGECLDDDRHGSMKLCTGSLERIPLLAGLRMQRITRKREGDPRAAIDERGFALAHQGSS